MFYEVCFNLGAAVEGASKRSESLATVALRLITREPETHPGGFRQSGCIMLHFAQSHNVSGIVAYCMPPSTAVLRFNETCKLNYPNSEAYRD